MTTDDQLVYIGQVYVKIRTGNDNKEFNANYQIIQLHDIRARVVFEKSEIVLHLKCLIVLQEQQLVLRIPALRWFCNHNGQPVVVSICPIYDIRRYCCAETG